MLKASTTPSCSISACIVVGLLCLPLARGFSLSTQAQEVSWALCQQNASNLLLSCTDSASIYQQCAVEGNYCYQSLIYGICNGTWVDLCPDGYFCPTYNTTILCSKGHSCRGGSIKPAPCFLSTIACPSDGMTTPVSVAQLGVVCGIIGMLILSYGFLEAKTKNMIEKLAPGKEFAFRKIRNPLSIQFHNLSFTLNSGTTILQNVTGQVSAGRLTALMGLSGAGKTTLLHVLRGRALGGTVKGDIFVNEHKCTSLNDYGDEIAFAPQDDIVYEDLTVAENIIYAALLFNRREYKTPKSVNPMVAKTLLLLGLENVAHSMVGGPEARGISGGERKRVSLAFEIVKEPKILLLDEPTTGLDSATSLSVLKVLHQLLAEGVTILLSIHQPRLELWNMLDDVILLSSRGKIVYCGSRNNSQYHFSCCGYTCPLSSNPADFFLDVLAGFVAPNKDASCVQEAILIQDQLAQHYISSIHSESTTAHPDNSSPLLSHSAYNSLQLQTLSITSILASSSVMDFKCAEEDFVPKKWWRHPHIAAVVFVREINRIRRKVTRLGCDCLVMLFIGALVYGLYGFPPFANTADMYPQIEGVQLTFGMVFVHIALRVFGNDMLMRRREEEASISFIAYDIGKILGSVPVILVMPLFFLITWHILTAPRGSFSDYFWFLALLAFVISSIANVLAFCVAKNTRGVVATAGIVIMWSFGGINPPPSIIKTQMGSFGTALYDLSIFKYSFQLQNLVEAEAFTPALVSRLQMLNQELSMPPLEFDSWSLKWKLLCYGCVLTAFTMLYHLASRTQLVWGYFRPICVPGTLERLSKAV